MEGMGRAPQRSWKTEPQAPGPGTGCRRLRSRRGRPFGVLGLQSCLKSHRGGLLSAFPLGLRFSSLLCIFLRSKENHHQFCITVKARQLPEKPSEASHPQPPALGSSFPPARSGGWWMFICLKAQPTHVRSPPGELEWEASCKRGGWRDWEQGAQRSRAIVRTDCAPMPPSLGNGGRRMGETVVIST